MNVRHSLPNSIRAPSTGKTKPKASLAGIPALPPHRGRLRHALRRRAPPASSGKSHRHRLNRAGDRQAACTLQRIARTQLARDSRTRAHRDRRIKEGPSTTEAIRCIERYTAREIYALLTVDRP